jgi:ATP-dependent DNA ligase I
MLLDDVVRTSAAVAAAPGRLAKVEFIARLLRDVPADEITIAASFLSGELTQRQIGVGYAALSDLTGGFGPAPPAAGQQAGPQQPGPAATPELTLADTDRVLGQIGQLSGPGSQGERRTLLAGLLARATAPERQFLVRLLAGDLRQGALDGVMTDAVARAADVPAAAVRRAYQLSGSLAATAAVALSPGAPGPSAGAPGRPAPVVDATVLDATVLRATAAAALAAVTLQVGRPVGPMLAASAPTVAAAMERVSPAAVDWKIDGIRVQLHRTGDTVRVFSRTLDDITDRVPEIAAAALTLRADSAVLDGEAVALRPDGRPRPFQVTSARAASQPGSGQRRADRDQLPLSLFLFDVLHLDGQDMLDVPAAERFARLSAVAPPELVIPRLVTADVPEAEDFYADAIGRGHEGVVVKSVAAPYGAGRRGSDWIKVKPRHTLDLVVLAAEWGHGRRQGWLSNLHLGARDPETGGLVMLGKTFKGLTDALLAWQTERLRELAEPAGADSRERHRSVVRVRPELVVEIAFDGVQGSTRYPGGVTLRFARVLRYRPDKTAAEADTIDAVRALWHPDDDQ